MSRTMIRFFTVADYKEEENWLREQHRSGLRLTKMTPPCFFHFEECEPEDVIYRLDYKNGKSDSTYKQMFLDFGWDFCGECLGWLYFRKPASEVEAEEEGEIFSDNESKLHMIRKIFRSRIIPLTIIFLCCVVPGFTRTIEQPDSMFFTVFWIIMLGLYIFLISYGGLKLMKLKRELSNE